jgi:hypothetical protein
MQTHAPDETSGLYADGVKRSEHMYFITTPERSKWRCELFGMGDSIVWHPPKGKEPNRFWRWMQYLAFGNRWRRDG